MQALFIILNDIYLINEIHELLHECEVGATTFDSSGLGNVLLEYEEARSTFTSLRKLTQGNKPSNKTIISVIKDEEKFEIVSEKINKVLNNIDKPGVGFMFSVPVNMIYGYKGKTVD